MSDTLLRLDNVWKRFGPVSAVADASFELARGELLTLLGPSGSGKSTILSMIAGFETVSSGEIYIEGKPQSRVPAHRRDIGVVFQSYALFPHLSVAENVAFALRSLRWPRAEIDARVAEMLAMVRLDGMAARSTAQLSGGQQQRVALARALAPRPALLLLDEPLSALDRHLRGEMLAEFQRIHRELGTTMLFVTHDQDEALAISDRVAVLNRGKIVQIAAPDVLYRDPATEFVASFIGEANLWPAEIAPDGRVRLASGQMLDVPHDFSPGAPCLVMVRPEHLAPSEAANAQPMVVTQRIYFGNATKYLLDAPSGSAIMRLPDAPGTPRYAPGESVNVGWQAETCRIIGKETAQ
ncbi:ABC transporter ATP-binding protein [Acuticoccus kandeliae]|uniref:ABC transporter ATP-binding protein n=1 Tax=Acuticoccus kandeliae TaxID=2073160 RepID=UPI000D3ED5B8|nr:ABC transporter ATP-binding protein [Acuticoccus kandeliae]